MYTSDISNQRKVMARTGFVYLFISLFCALFGGIYEIFSHEVYSYYMIYGFAIPLAGGVLPFFSLAFSSIRPPGRISRELYHSGIAALTVGSIIKGVLDIYGTTNRLVFVYLIAGGGLILIGLVIYASERNVE